MDNILVGNVYKCSTNDDFYVVCEQNKNGKYKTFWLKIGYAEDDGDDIQKDKLIRKIPAQLIGKIILSNYLSIIRKSYEISSY